MIRVSVLYPSGEGKQFDHAYYAQKHMPLVGERLLRRDQARPTLAHGAQELLVVVRRGVVAAADRPRRFPSSSLPGCRASRWCRSAPGA